jgi:prevent-host-death family protein
LIIEAITVVYDHVHEHGRILALLKERMMQTLKASEFKAKCLILMDEVQKTGNEIVITKNGKPVSKLVPYRVKSASLFGLHKNKISSLDQDVFSTDEKWKAD